MARSNTAMDAALATQLGSWALNIAIPPQDERC
jgi:hypothetical protein